MCKGRSRERERTAKEGRGGWAGSDDCMSKRGDKELGLLKEAEAVAASALPIASRS